MAERLFQLLLGVMMAVLPFRDQMIVIVRVRDRVGVGAAVVRVHKGVLVQMRVVADERIHHNERGAGKHDREGDEIDARELFVQEHERQKRPDERRHGIVGAGFRRAEIALRADIEENAQPVRHKAEQQRKAGIAQRRERLARDQRDQERARAAAEPLERDDLIGAPGGDAARAVVLKAPADRGEQHKQRAHGKAEAVRAIKGQQNARERDEGDRRPEALRDRLAEETERDDRRRDDLEVAEQRRVGGGAVSDAEHEQNGRRNIEHDHADHIFEILPCQPLPTLSAAERQKADAQPRAEIKKRRHHGRADLREQQLGERDVDRIKRRREQGEKDRFESGHESIT